MYKILSGYPETCEKELNELDKKYKITILSMQAGFTLKSYDTKTVILLTTEVKKPCTV